MDPRWRGRPPERGAVLPAGARRRHRHRAAGRPGGRQHLPGAGARQAPVCPPAQVGPPPPHASAGDPLSTQARSEIHTTLPQLSIPLARPCTVCMILVMLHNACNAVILIDILPALTLTICSSPWPQLPLEWHRQSCTMIWKSVALPLLWLPMLLSASCLLGLSLPA